VAWKPGLGGTEPAGDGESTIHMRCDRVAQSLATVWARVLTGVTWKTGYESWPSFTPRSERMMEMKWMHVSLSNGMEELSVSSYIEHVNQCHLQRRGRVDLPSRPHG
jgi:hypothetical protein